MVALVVAGNKEQCPEGQKQENTSHSVGLGKGHERCEGAEGRRGRQIAVLRSDFSVFARGIVSDQRAVVA